MSRSPIRGWHAAAGVFVVLGGLGTLLLGDAVGRLEVSASIGVVAGFVTLMLRSGEGEDLGPAVLAGVRVVPPCAVAVLAVNGVLGLLGPTGLLPVLGLLVTSPPAVGWVLCRVNQVLATLEGPERCTTAAEPDDLSTSEIVAGWRATTVLMKKLPPDMDRAPLVEQRCRYLDELERREPSGVAAWLQSGRALDVDPGAFVGPQGPDGYETSGP